MSKRSTHHGFFGWLGRQVGYVAGAVRRDGDATSDPAADKTVYRSRTVEQVPDPRDPRRTLRRTVIDEAIEPEEAVEEGGAS